jgi:hypothetical protein
MNQPGARFFRVMGWAILALAVLDAALEAVRG